MDLWQDTGQHKAGPTLPPLPGILLLHQDHIAEAQVHDASMEEGLLQETCMDSMSSGSLGSGKGEALP